MKVINLGVCRDILKEWEAVRQHILSGHIKGGALCLRDFDDTEAIFLFGTHKADPDAALRAGMRMSWEITQAGELEPAKLQANE